MLFNLIGGKHTQDGKVYKKGDVVESDVNLRKVFGKKFVRVMEETEKSEVNGPISTAPVLPLPPPLNKGEGVVTPAPSPTLSKIAKEKIDLTIYGKDTSDLFPLAGKVDCKVFRKGSAYTVVDMSDGCALNKKALSRRQVKSFIEENLGK